MVQNNIAVAFSCFVVVAAVDECLFCDDSSEIAAADWACNFVDLDLAASYWDQEEMDLQVAVSEVGSAVERVEYFHAAFPFLADFAAVEKSVVSFNVHA